MKTLKAALVLPTLTLSLMACGFSASVCFESTVSFIFIFCLLTGLKSSVDILHDIFKGWGMHVNVDDSPSSWGGVTCAANGVDILVLNMQCEDLSGKNLK